MADRGLNQRQPCHDMGAALRRGGGVLAERLAAGTAIEFGDLVVAELGQPTQAFDPAVNARPFVAAQNPAQVIELGHATLRATTDPVLLRPFMNRCRAIRCDFRQFPTSVTASQGACDPPDQNLVEDGEDWNKIYE